jgi:hypothetical protein
LEDINSALFEAEFGTDFRFARYPTGIVGPRWSPDGHFIAALSADLNELMIYDRAARKWRRLAGDFGTIGTPAWSHDGKYLYLDVASPHDRTYMRVKFRDGKAEQLASLKNIRRFLGMWGSWSGLAPGDIPLLARDTGEQEVYALDLRLPWKRQGGATAPPRIMQVYGLKIR